ncbi:MAG: hypothetical protein R3272_11570 [Candidatus Promineifilaceae bacterium]|nr:hypothetical protein [Candidatus Promineifilaceae bacterium]
MAKEWEATLTDLMQSVARQIRDSAELSVVTKYVLAERLPGRTVEELGEGEGEDSADRLAERLKRLEAEAVALTEMRWDGDFTAIVPVNGAPAVSGEEGEVETNPRLTVDGDLYDLHLQHVEAAKAYRRELIDWILRAVNELR